MSTKRFKTVINEEGDWGLTNEKILYVEFVGVSDTTNFYLEDGTKILSFDDTLENNLYVGIKKLAEMFVESDGKDPTIESVTSEELEAIINKNQISYFKVIGFSEHFTTNDNKNIMCNMLDNSNHRLIANFFVPFTLSDDKLNILLNHFKISNEFKLRTIDFIAEVSHNGFYPDGSPVNPKLLNIKI